MTAALLGSMVAYAADTERWQDAVTSRPPRGAHVTANVVGLPLGDSGFLDLTAGLGTDRSRGAGAGLTVATSGVVTPGVEGAIAYVRLGGVNAWGSLTHGWGRQAVSIGWVQPVHSDRSTFRFHPSETERRLLLRYSVRGKVGPFELMAEPRIGIAVDYPEFTHTVAAAWPVVPERLALTLGVSAGVAPMGTAVLGLQARPAKGVEVGVFGGSAFPIFRELPGPDLQLGLQLKVWGGGRDDPLTDA
ncbi:MAG: hypothetical protein KTR31_18705 [Myxococcales bacterium]|nr:hypothetical protein [Myxococcales bacterium]